MTRYRSLPLLVLGVAIAAQPVQSQPPGGFGGPGPGTPERELVDKFDTNDDGWLDRSEREQAREFVKENPAPRRGPGGPGFGPPPGSDRGRDGFGPPPGFGPPDGFGPPPRFEGDRGDFRPPPGSERGRDGSGPPDGFGPRPGFEPGRDGFGPPQDFGPPRGFGRRGEGPGRGGPGMMGRERPPATPGETIDKSSVQPIQADLYDTSVLRTIFIDFENKDWEAELEDFHGTDVDVAATLTVDGQTYRNCGIHFRGMSSYGMVPAGYKRSLNVSIDMADPDQRLLGYKTLNLLNGSGDDSMLSTVLYSHISGKYLPTPKANFVRVVINGENWGIYTNVQQFNKDFLEAHFESSEGTRWKVSGSPAGGGGLQYRGENPDDYGHPYEMKSSDKKALAKLIELCRVLDQTPADKLPAAIESMVDIDGLLWFLALDNSLINSDGYWIRASDYSIFLDKDDRFHFFAHDMNEAFRPAMGPGMGGPPGGRDRGRESADGRGRELPTERDRGNPTGSRSPQGPPAVDLDPLIGLDDPSKPLRSKILAVPGYQRQYLQNVREIAQTSLDWNQLGPFVASQVTLIDDAVKAETRKLGTYEAFAAAVKTGGENDQPATSEVRGGHRSMNLRAFAEARRNYLLQATQPAEQVRPTRQSK